MANYNLVFQGEIIAGTSLAEVKANVARLFKADTAKTAALFSGKTIIIKRNLTLDAAKKYLAVLKKAGAVVKAVKVDEPTEIETEAKTETPAAEQSADGSKGLSAGLASLINYNKSSSLSEDESAENDPVNYSLQLAPLGAIIPNLKDHKNDLVIPDLSHLTLSEAESGTLEEFSSRPEPVELPDIENLSISASNEGYLAEFTPKPEPVVLPDISSLDITEQNDTPLSSETPKTASLPLPDTSELSMSEAQQGSLEGLKKKPEPVNIPETSHLGFIEAEESEQVEGKAVFQIN